MCAGGKKTELAKNLYIKLLNGNCFVVAVVDGKHFSLLFTVD